MESGSRIPNRFFNIKMSDTNHEIQSIQQQYFTFKNTILNKTKHESENEGRVNKMVNLTFNFMKEKKNSLQMEPEEKGCSVNHFR